MGDPFDPPPGDGASMLAAAKSMGAVKSDLSTDIGKVRGGVSLAQTDWRAQREQDFDTGVFGIQTQLVLTEDGIGNVAKIMSDYGRAVNATTTEVANLKSQADKLKTQITAAQKAAAKQPQLPSIPGGPGDTSGLYYQLSQLETQATSAKSALTKLAGQFAAAIDAQTNKLVPGGASMNPAAIRRAVMYGLDVNNIGPNGSGLNRTNAWAIMGTAQWQGQQVLDLVEDNADGEKAGGPSTYLMTDVGELQQLLDAARADGIEPHDYSTLLAQYWAARAAKQAGINLDAWDPSKGTDGNSATISAVYTFYGKLFLNDPKLQWAGMAAMIGPSFAGGFLDLNMMKNLADDLGKPINDLPGFIKDSLPPQLQGIAAISKLSASELQWYEQKFLAMQKHIFFDQGAMHMAYTHGGLQNISEMYQAGLIDDNAMTAWDDIDSGDPTLISQGNELLLSREQNQIIANQYDQMYNHDKPIGPAMTYLMTVVGSASIPGTKTPGEYSPLTFGASASLPGPIPFVTGETIHGEVITPLPNFNIANKDERWNYVINDTLPAYRKLLAQNPAEARQIIETPVDQRIAQQRLLNRIPQLVDEGLTDWGVEVDGDVDAFGLHVGGGVHIGH